MAQAVGSHLSILEVLMDAHCLSHGQLVCNGIPQLAPVRPLLFPGREQRATNQMCASSWAPIDGCFEAPEFQEVRRLTISSDGLGDSEPAHPPALRVIELSLFRL